MQFIDTHAHLTFDELSGNLDEVLMRANAAGVGRCITVGTTLDDTLKAAHLAEMHDNIWATAGIHPHYAKDVTEPDFENLRELARHQKIVAVGETGLDFHYNLSAKAAQNWLFERHLDIAKEFDLPIIVHSRNAFDETLEILDKQNDKLGKVVFHCFGGDAKQAAALLERGYFISFTGVVTFKNAETARESAKIVPLDRLMLETDCPYMSPEPMRNIRPCEPSMLVHTAKFIAELKNMALAEFATRVFETSLAFFGLS